MTETYAPREVLGDTLVEAAKADPRLLVLDADLGRSTRLTAFEDQFPDRYIQMGVAEQNAVGVASGLVYAGYHPVFVTFTMFAIGLPWTQLRQAAYAKLPIKVIATHPGFDIGPDGGTHQMLEDIALARSIPEITILSPCDTPETIAAIRSALSLDQLVYIRVGRHPVPNLHNSKITFPIGKSEILLDGGIPTTFLIIADGSMTSTALQAGRILQEENIPTTIVNIRTIKPIDREMLIGLSESAAMTITLENHSVLGGLGGAVAEVLAEVGRRVIRLGSPDKFGETGSTEELRALYNLDLKGVLKTLHSYTGRLEEI